MKKTLKKTLMAAFWGLLISAAWLAASGPIHAATTYQASLVPVQADTVPGFSARGSSIKIVSNNQLRMKGKIKQVVDVDGNRVTTRPEDSDDDYTVEVDFFVPATDDSGTISMLFDLKNGNGKFRMHVNGNDAFPDAMRGDGVVIEEVRIFDASHTLIGVGGVSLRAR